VKNIRDTFLLFVISLVLCCVAYPLVLWAFAQTLFPTTANGSLVAKADGTNVGSLKIAQAFTKDEYFWPRPSAAGYNAAAAGGSNWGASNPKLRDRVAQQLGPLVRYKNGKPVGPDIEAWFVAAPDRAAKWASASATSASHWATADKSGDEYGPNGKFVQQWAVSHPGIVADWKKANPTKTDEPKPEDLVGAFFVGFSEANPGTFPGVVATKAVDGTVSKTVQPVRDGATIQTLFFDMWLQDPAYAAKAAEIEPVPADFVTASGAGLDPHITMRNARWQLARVAAARAGTTDAATIRKQIETILDKMAAAPLAGLAGEPLVNVLELNLELDRQLSLNPAK
jgi:potassium-transporting ATPase KdpC subunit